MVIKICVISFTTAIYKESLMWRIFFTANGSGFYFKPFFFFTLKILLQKI